ncbi:MAG: hypothetical protein JSS66_17400 [Armatimonadetes bacterium]|nr:hypothetical protein [Armatimonadota bacterium]
MFNRKFNMSLSNRKLAIVLALTTIGTCLPALAQPSKAFANSTSNVKKPGMILGQTESFAIEQLGGKPNADVRESGFTLRNLVEGPIERELVWAYDLTDPMPMTYSQGAWTLNDPAKRTVRMYYHIGFDASGKAVAAAKWYHGPSPMDPVFAQAREAVAKGPSSAPASFRSGPGRPGTPPPTRPTLYWNYNLGSLISDGRVSKISHWIVPFEGGTEKEARVTGKGGNLVVHKVPGTLKNNGWFLVEGEDHVPGAEAVGALRWYATGRGYPVEEQPDGAVAVVFWDVQRSMANLADAVLYLEVTDKVRVARGKIVPSTNDKAVQQNGVR